jgi:hypothetical protein
MGGACGTYARQESYRVLVERPKVKRPLGRLRSRWEDNIKMDTQDVYGAMYCIGVAQNKDRWRAVVNTVMNLQVP